VRGSEPRIDPCVRACARPGAPGGRGWARAVRSGAAGLATAAVLLAACGPSPTVHIPTPSASPTTPRTPRPSTGLPSPRSTASPEVIAPGVRVPSVALHAPHFTVSRQHPPPPGTPVSKVVADFLRDNYIENVALERADPRLLKYADGGRLLAAIRNRMVSSSRRRVVSIVDHFTSIQVGRKRDPNNARDVLALIVSGTEREIDRIATQVAPPRDSHFQSLFWCQWSRALGHYLLMDDATS